MERDADAGELPRAFVAITETEYETPFSNGSMRKSALVV